MREVSGSSTSVPPFKCAIACVEGLADLLFSQWGVDLKVEYGFWPIRVELSAQLFDAFLLHPDKIIGDWVRNLDFRLRVCQNEKKILILLRIFNTGKEKNFFLRLLMHKKRPSYNETFYWYWVGCLHFLLSHGNISITHVKQSYNDNNWNLKVRWQVTGATILLIYEFKLLQYSIIMGIITRRVFTSQINP